MNTPDLKKLVTVFLTLSVITTSSVLLFSNTRSGYSTSQELAEEKNIRSPEDPSASQNVFVEPVPEYSLALEQQGETDSQKFTLDVPPIKDPSNQTERFIRNVVQELAEANPNGPENLAGESAFAAPSEEEFSALLNQHVGAVGADEFPEQIPLSEIDIIKKPSPEEVSEYLIAVADALKQTTAGDQLTRLQSLTPSVEVVNAALLVNERLQNRLGSLRVPIQLVNTHRSLLASLRNRIKMFKAVRNYETDPVKVLAYEQVAQSVMDRDFQRFMYEFNKLDFIEVEPSASRYDGALSLASAAKIIFGIQEAHALSPGVPTAQTGNYAVEDIVHHRVTELQKNADLAQKFFEWAREIGTEILKNQLVHTLIKQIIDWVKGGGDPQFITDFRTFVSDSFNQAAGYALQQIAPQFCKSFGPIATLSLQRIQSLQPVVGCTLEKIGVNVERFFDRFENGSWVAYTSSFSAGGNVWTAIVQARDTMAKFAQDEAGASRNESTANEGFKGVKICSKPWLDGSYKPIGGTCTLGAKLIITTPGGAVGTITSNAIIKGPVERIVNADDLAALVSAIVDSFIGKMIKAGIAGITGALNDDTSVYGRCDGLSGGALSTCLSTSDSSFRGPTAPAPSGLPTYPGLVRVYENPTESTCVDPDGDPPCSGFSDPDEFNACFESCF